MVDILVRQEQQHGISSQECVPALRDRLPDAEIAFASSPEREQRLIEDATIVVGGNLPASLLDSATNLDVFACSWAGVGHLDLESFADRGIAVTNAAGVHGPNIAEHVIGWWLLITRRLDEGMRRQERSEWRHFQAMGELHGSRVAVIGLGAIGTAIVRCLEGFDVETVGVRYSPEKGGPTDEVYGFEEIETAVQDVSYLVAACPLTDETEGLIDDDVLTRLPPHAVLVNIARGGVVETDALVHALRSNSIHAAGLDVTDPEPLPADHPLWNLGNAYITPHNAGHTPQYWERLADIVAQNLETLSEGGGFDELQNRVA